jgi:hypothetical protein
MEIFSFSAAIYCTPHHRSGYHKGQKLWWGLTLTCDDRGSAGRVVGPIHVD